MEQLERLRKITSHLRSPDGCPWDREQDYFSMRPALIEEAHEVVAAINQNDLTGLKEELGDLLFCVLFYVQLAEERGDFQFEDVAREISEKLIRRHPHVFADTNVNHVSEIIENWEKIKETEHVHKKGSREKPRLLEGVQDSFPGLLRAYKTQKKMAKIGFDWKSIDGALEKIVEEAQELRRELETPQPDRLRVEQETGDLLFSVVNLSRHLDVEPELALHGTIDRFHERVQKMEQFAKDEGKELSQLSEGEMDRLWERAKK